MGYLGILLVGAFLCNCIPHLVAGLQGHPFPTPFAKPRGVGNSSALVNFLWGAANLFLGLFLLWRHLALAETVPGVIVLALGFLILGVYMARHFEKVALGAHGDVARVDEESPTKMPIRTTFSASGSAPPDVGLRHEE